MGRRTIIARAPVIVNRQSAVRVPLPELERFLARVQRALRVPVGSVTICFVTNGQMARWNSAYRNKRGPTDVLSFPVQDGTADAMPPSSRQEKSGRRKLASHNKNAFSFTSFPSFISSASYLGDIAIAPAVACANARRFGRTLSDELRILILHGVIHLMGYDHEADHGEMDRFEHSIRRSLGLAQP